MSLAVRLPRSRRLRQAPKAVAWMLLGVVLAGAAALGVLRLCGYQMYGVASDSMQPAIRKGDAVLISTESLQPRPGQVLSYRSPVNSKVVITHRVIAVDAKHGLIVTQGDHAAAPDAAIPQSAVIGHAIRHIPLFGYILSALRQPFGLLIAVYLPAISILAAEYRNLVRYYTSYAPRRYVLYR